jgi:pimeloyl-ACP methyl ester carboxylesterase
MCTNFDECRNAIINAVDQAYPSQDQHWTMEVDVIGMSLGGLVARYAAAPSRDAKHPRQLKIARLFTISSPLGGATLAQALGFTDFHRDMQPGSKFIMTVAQSDADAKYELYEYVHLHDEVVGEQYAAIPGTRAWWLSTPPLISPHFAAMIDDRILADIARRLRGEEPFSHSPPAPLPSADYSLSRLYQVEALPESSTVARQ